MRQKEAVAVLIPAAGSGSRLGGAKKQFRLLDGKSLLTQTLRVFERHPGVDLLLVAVAEEDVEVVSKELAAERLSKLYTVEPGGASRQGSVQCILDTLPASVDLVLVHDAVRPFVSSELISEVIEASRRIGAAAPAVPVVDTLRIGAHGVFGDTVPREGIFRMQTPQGGRRDWFDLAYDRAGEKKHQATDDVELLRWAGYEVAIVEGSLQNFKITTQPDWDLARILWPEWKQFQSEGN